MIKKLFSMAVVTMSALFVHAQGQNMELPLSPDVRHGVLPNGLNYYVLHNEEPKERANFYIAQKVGSTLEAPDQLGLAHFLEHMAFNGTKNFPGKNMLNYLQSKGIRFGSDINAYTSFDETVYRIDNVPTTDKALMDSVLLAIHDWSGSILLEEDEINAERGVIEEEWRSRNSATQRMYETILPIIYSEYQYQQMPIGKMEIVRNFPPQAIRDYYKKWYRPDQQGIIIVGDFDAEEMEKKVIALFSTIPMPANAAPRTYPKVSDNVEPIFAAYSDKELTNPMIMVSFKSEKIPTDSANTVLAYMQHNIIENITSRMINNRLDEMSNKPSCKYVGAGVFFDDFLVSKTKASFNINILAKNDIQGAYSEVLGIVAQACKAGFLPLEVERARDEVIAEYEKRYNERNNTKNTALGNELCRHFIDNEPMPGREMDYQLVSQFANMLPVEAYNEFARNLMTPNNQVIVVGQPAKDEMIVVSKEEMVNGLANAINSDYEMYVDEVITDPLIENLAAPGKITSESAGQFGTTEFTLSNGAKVIVKPTDFKADEILIKAYKQGGMDVYDKTEAMNVVFADAAVESSKLGKFDRVKLGKYLAGKNIGLDYAIGRKFINVNGQSTVKDLPTFMEVLYSTFTELNPDNETFNSTMEKVKSQLENQDKNPQMVWSRHVNATQYDNNPFFMNPTVEDLSKVDYAKSLDIVKESLSNAADYTFVIVGNVDMETLKPMLEKYVASLPSTGKKSEKKVINDNGYVNGQVTDDFTHPMQAPMTMVYGMYHDNNIPYSIENAVKVGLMGDVLDNIFTETLREEEGGTYSPYAGSSIDPYDGTWNLRAIFFTNADAQEKLIKRANDEYMKLLSEGASETHFNKVKEAAMKQYEIGLRSNSKWLNDMMRYSLGIDDITNHKAAIENLTLDEFNKFLKSIYNGKNRVQVIMTGVEDK
ncbi:MAG: insulinase family protein [Candidatus Amulumruptor caecigallinarius]|nr:insulinase family protein [Candidatus Amulumruptor caecigallinarius]